MSAARILEELRNKKKSCEERLMSQGIADFPSYKYCVGEISGLDFAIKNLIRILGENK